MLSNPLKSLVNQKSHALALVWEIQTRERITRELEQARKKGATFDELQRLVAETKPTII
jgi:Arc/MetJ family transcription regulator